MSEWKPKLRADLRRESLSLTAAEGFLLSRIDGSTSVDNLRHLTGLSTEQVTQALAKLQSSGAIDPPPSLPAVRPRPAPIEVNGVLNDKDAIRAALEEMSDDTMILPPLEGDDTDEGEATDEGVAEPPDTDEGAEDAKDNAEDAKDNAEDAEDNAEDNAEHEVDEDEEGEPRDEAAAALEEGNHRKLFETTLHDLPQEEREKLARVEVGNVLCALCFDPVAQVINGIVENPQVGFAHARLIARHHRTPQGLDAVFKRAEFVRDGQVQRYLLANPMLQDAHLKKILQPKRLAIVYQWALSRDIPEKNRNKVRQMLRTKWSTAEGEERANLVFSTEGRVLLMLAGLPFDSQTISLLCQRTYNSTLLIQNLARFAATPPLLISHLMKQAVVKRQVHLRNMLLQHPNCPADLKRKTH